MIGLALASGDTKSSKIYSPLMQTFNKISFKEYEDDYSKSVKDFVIILHVSGEVTNFDFEGCETPKYNKRTKRLSIDVGIPQSKWTGIHEELIKDNLKILIQNAINLSTKFLEDKKVELPNQSTLNKLNNIISIF